MHDLGLLCADPEANLACFSVQCGRGMMQLWFIFFEQGDVIGEIQVTEMIEFRPVDAGPNAYYSLAYLQQTYDYTVTRTP